MARTELLGKFHNCLFENFFIIFTEFFCLFDICTDFGLFGMHEFDELVFKCLHIFYFYRHEISFDGCINLDDLVFDGHRLVLWLDQHLHRPFTGVNLGFGALIEVRSKLGKSCQFAVLCQAQTECAGNFLHGLDLSRPADTGYGEADVDSRPYTGVE